MTKPTYEELAAHIERLREIIYRDRSATRFAEVVAIIDQHHADSLAALKAQWQTDFLSTISQKLLSAQKTGFIKIPKNIETHTDFIEWLNGTQEPTND